jgi:hypothetical protein
MVLGYVVGVLSTTRYLIAVPPRVRLMEQPVLSCRSTQNNPYTAFTSHESITVEGRACVPRSPGELAVPRSRAYQAASAC